MSFVMTHPILASEPTVGAEPRVAVPRPAEPNAAAPNAAELLDTARQAMTAGQYDRAAESYKTAESLLPDRPELAYNQGVAQYRKGDYERAAGCFGKALGAADRALDAKAKFNLGNCAYATALKLREKEPDKAVEQLRQALMHYRDAIETAPKDADARANLELAGTLLKQLQEQKKEEQKQPPQSQPSSQPQSQPESQPESQPSSQPEQSQNKQNQQQKGQQQNSQQQGQKDQQQGDAQQGQKKDASQEKGKLESQADQKDAKDKQDQQPVPIPTTQRAMTPEELERLLQLVRDRERQRMLEQRHMQRNQAAPVEKDW